jgi:mono/diheme cytochrome c family protein
MRVLFLLGAGLLLTGCGGDNGPATTAAPGADLYAQNCAMCHLPEGAGMAGMQPALRGDAIVAGDPSLLIRVVLLGPARVLPPNPDYRNVMPAFDRLSDEDLATLLGYVRNQFGGADAVTADEVKAVRAKAD